MISGYSDNVHHGGEQRTVLLVIVEAPNILNWDRL